MEKISFLFFFIIGSITTLGQHTVSGYIHLEDPETWEKSVHLIKLGLEDQTSNRLIAKAAIQEDGFFAFDDSVFTRQDEIYKLLVQKSTFPNGKPESAETSSRPFIISNNDSLFFTKDNGLAFSSFTSSSKADEEWQQLQRHEASSQSDISMGTEKYLQETRDYTKDSLQILLVKLLSIQTLDEQKLLDKDIQENANYYMDLLDKLQESDLPPASYAYLENKIRKAHHKLLQRRYYTSLAFNGIGLLAVAGLLYLLLRMRKSKNQEPQAALSKQEENIKTLILEGKTNKEIAAELFISISTVKTHITNIYSKLNVSTRKELRLKS